MSAPRSAAERAVWACLAAAAVLALATCAVLFALRLGYPFELEWMEGAMVDHAARVRAGASLYAPPSPEHIAGLYTPLLYQLAALLSFVVGPGFVPLRLVSIGATLASCALLFAWARRETGRRLSGLLAAGLFAAGYGYLRYWYDLGRNDSLFTACMLGAGYLLRFGARRGAVVASALATLAFLSKQTALLWLPALALGAALLEWRKGLLFCALAALGIGGSVLVADAASDGWFCFFVFDMPSGHRILRAHLHTLLKEDTVPLLPMLVGVLWCCVARWRGGRAREAWFLAAFAGGGLCASAASRLHEGGYDNVLMYGVAVGCLLLPACCGSGPRAPRGVLALLALQFLLLAVDVRSLWLPRLPAVLFAPAKALPSPTHRRASEELVAYLRQQPGEVLVPYHGYLAALAGKRPGFHTQFLLDLLGRFAADVPKGQFGRGPQRAFAALMGSFRTALEERRWSVIVLDSCCGTLFENTFAAWVGGYARLPEAPIAPNGLCSAIGMQTYGLYVLARRP